MMIFVMLCAALAAGSAAAAAATCIQTVLAVRERPQRQKKKQVLAENDRGIENFFAYNGDAQEEIGE